MTSIIIESLVSLFDSILCIYFITKYNKRPVRGNKLFFPTILSVFIITIIGDFVAPGYNTLTTLILFVLNIAYALLIHRKYYVSAIISACIWKITYILLSSLLYQILSVTIANFNDIMQGSSGLHRYTFLLLHKIFLFVIVKFILMSSKADNSVDIKNGVLTLLVSLITLLGTGTAMRILMSGTIGSMEIPMLMITLIFAVMNISVYFLIYQVQRLQKSKFEVEFLKQKLAYESKRYNDTSIIWNEICQFRHDFKQHLTVIKCRLEDNNIKGCKEYINDLMPSIEKTIKMIKSDNSIIDYLINSKLSNLPDTDVVISGAVSGFSDIKETDLACLIGNILDNAVEGVKNIDRKKIELTFHNENYNRVIICKNTISESVLASNRKLKSTKENKIGHGYGHFIIEKIVDKYNGMLDYFEDGDMFGIQVVLPLPPDLIK